MAALLTAPFVIAYLVLFIYPSLKMVELSFTNAPLIGSGNFAGLRNYVRLTRDHLFLGSIIHTAYFVLLTVIPNTLIGLGIAILVNRLRGRMRATVLACFFVPYVLPSTVVYESGTGFSTGSSASRRSSSRLSPGIPSRSSPIRSGPCPWWHW
jgi:multiple sugar transport system permease protein